MPRAGLTADAIVELALTSVDAGEAVSLAGIAELAGVKTPSLYKHIESLDALRSAVAAAIMHELAAALEAAAEERSGHEAHPVRDAVASREDRLQAIMLAHRAWAVAHRERYLALPVQPRDDVRLSLAAERLLNVFAHAIEPGSRVISASTVHRIRGIRAATHGFVMLELAGGFAMHEDVEESYRLLCERLRQDG